MIAYLKHGLAEDALIAPQAAQSFVDLTCETSKLSQPIAGAQVVDFSFLEKARKDLASVRQF